MNELCCKRIYAAQTEEDGFRILVDRLWPRGVRKETARIDLWAKDIAPSAALRRRFDHDPERFGEFTALYTAELAANSAAEEFLRAVRERLTCGRVTLLYAARDTECNHAIVLRAWLESKLK